MENNVSYILMIDHSGSMHREFNQVKIDANAFIGSSIKGDEFGVNKFSTKAAWVYPTGDAPKICKVSEDKTELLEARKAVDAIKTENLTNTGAAIDLAQKMIVNATCARKALVLLTDGDANEGTMPENVYTGSVPLYIGALGLLSQTKLEKLKNKNPENKIYLQPSAYHMSEMMNAIRGDTTGSLLITNDTDTYMGSYFQLQEMVLSEDAPLIQFSVTWSDARCHYTSGIPAGYGMNVYLIDQDGNQLDIKPDVQQDGMCVFTRTNVKAGTWRLLVQYSVDAGSTLSGTVGGFLFTPNFAIRSSTPQVNAAADPFTPAITVFYDGKMLDDVQAKLTVVSPGKNYAAVAAKYTAEDTPAVRNGLEAPSDPKQIEREINAALETRVRFLNGRRSNGTLSCSIDNTLTPGPYNLTWEISGVNPQTKKPFRFIRNETVIVK